MVNPNKRGNPVARLSKNYLTLIVGLIALICVVVGLAIAFAAPHLDAAQRWTLISFLYVFGLGGLGAAVFLILRHAKKLAVSECDDEIVWELMPPETQRQKLKLEVSRLAALLNIPENQMSDLSSAYIVAEDLALRQIEQEEKTPTMRHVRVGNADFDAVFIKENVVTCVETTFQVTPIFPDEKINALANKMAHAKKTLAKVRPGSKVKLLIVIITQFDARAEAEMRALLHHSRFGGVPVDIDFNHYDFENLQSIFAN